MQKFWCGVVNRDDALCAVQGGYCQFGSAKAAPLARMAVGDGLVVYSPTTTWGGKEKCQAFTAIGIVTGAAPYPFAVTADRVPYRRAVAYHPGTAAAIRPLMERLVITAGFANWGFKFRLGHFEIGAADFALIAHAMQAGTLTGSAAPASLAVPTA